MPDPIDVIMTDKWTVGYSAEHDVTLLLFEFTDRAPINLAISRGNAEKIAKAIQNQLQNPPPMPGKLN